MAHLQCTQIPQTTLPIVVGIHFGSRRCWVACSYRATPDQMWLGAPSALPDTRASVPHSVLVNDDGSFEFGYAAEARYNEYLEAQKSGQPLPGHLYSRFTEALRHNPPGAGPLMAVSSAGKQHSLMDIVVKSLLAVKDYSVRRVSANYNHRVAPTKDMQWALAIPDSLNDFAMAFMRKAAFQAGLAATEQSENLMLVSEPEAAAMSVHIGAPEQELITKGSRIAVINCEGSSFHIGINEVQSVAPLQLQAITTPNSGAWGREYVNEEFRKFLRELLGPELYQQTEQPYESYTIFTDFDRVKKLFEPPKDPANIRLIDVLDNQQQLVDLAAAYNQRFPDTPVLESSVLRSGFLSMSKALMLSFFEPTLKAVVAGARSALQGVSGVNAIMVIGFCDTHAVLIERLKAEFHMKNGLRVIPYDPLAITRGAVYCGLYREVQQRRVAAYHYGLAMRRSGGTDEHDAFEVIVGKGEELLPDHSVSRFALPVSVAQEAIVWTLYRTQGDEEGAEPPPTVAGLVKLGRVTAPCPPGPDFMARRQHARFMFGGHEITVVVEGPEGAETRATVAF